MEKTMDRRRFVQLAGASALGMMAFKLVGCSPASGSTDAQGEESAAAAESSDALIVGGGGSGLAAGVTLAEAGKSVTVIEALGMVGGATSCAEFQTVTTKEGVEGKNDKDAMFEFWWANAEQKANEGLVRQVADNCADTLAWLEGHGLALYDMVGGEQLSSPMFFRTPDPEGNLIAGNGAIVTNLLHDRFVELGGTLHTNTEAQAFLVDDSGAVVGVEALRDGKPVEFTASKVILATGGFAGGAGGEGGEVLEKHAPALLGKNILNHDFAGGTGHGIVMAEEIGAATRFEGQCCRGNIVIQGDGKFGNGLVGMVPGGIVMVNGEGKRFTNEANPMVRQVFNDALENDGTDGLYVFVPQEMVFDGVVEDIEKGYAFQGSSVADVAAHAGVSDAVVKTIEDYNADVAAGVDSLCGKPAEALVPIEGDPVTLYKAWVRVGGSIGGIMTDEETRVVTDGGDVIPNLYAVGDCANTNFHYKTYQGSGTGTCWAMNSGRIAAQNVLASL